MNVKRISPATAIASAALFFSLGGTGLAASHYLITSTRQIAPSVRLALKGEHGSPGATGAPGAAGPEGVPGAIGAQGATGQTGASLTFDSAPLLSARTTLTAGGTTAVVVDCPTGQVVVDGGYVGSGETVTSSFAKDPYEWVVIGSAQSEATSASVQAWAWCASTS